MRGREARRRAPLRRQRPDDSFSVLTFRSAASFRPKIRRGFPAGLRALSGRRKLLAQTPWAGRSLTLFGSVFTARNAAPAAAWRTSALTVSIDLRYFFLFRALAAYAVLWERGGFAWMRSNLCWVI